MPFIHMNTLPKELHTLLKTIVSIHSDHHSLITLLCPASLASPSITTLVTEHVDDILVVGVDWTDEVGVGEQDLLEQDLRNQRVGKLTRVEAIVC